MKRSAMQHAESTARMVRPSSDAILRALELLGEREQKLAARGSGFYAITDEFAGLEQLERAELDEE